LGTTKLGASMHIPYKAWDEGEGVEGHPSHKRALDYHCTSFIFPFLHSKHIIMQAYPSQEGITAILNEILHVQDLIPLTMAYVGNKHQVCIDMLFHTDKQVRIPMSVFDAHTQDLRSLDVARGTLGVYIHSYMDRTPDWMTLCTHPDRQPCSYIPIRWWHKRPLCVHGDHVIKLGSIPASGSITTCSTCGGKTTRLSYRICEACRDTSASGDFGASACSRFHGKPWASTGWHGQMLEFTSSVTNLPPGLPPVDDLFTTYNRDTRNIIDRHVSDELPVAIHVNEKTLEASIHLLGFDYIDLRFAFLDYGLKFPLLRCTLQDPQKVCWVHKDFVKQASCTK
jgi:hypothetical protein